MVTAAIFFASKNRILAQERERGLCADLDKQGQ
jgi:hypothetical protein